MSAFFTTGAAELERQTLAALRAFHLRGTTAPSPGAPPPIAPPPVGPTPASPPEVEPHDPFYWRNVVASLEQTAGPKLDATTKLAARLEAQHKLTPLVVHGPNHAAMVFQRDDIIKWQRLAEFQAISLRIIAHFRSFPPARSRRARRRGAEASGVQPPQYTPHADYPLVSLIESRV